jgi:hypothetical protein
LAFFNKPTDLPVDQVKALRGRGFDNNQIVQALQRSGYSSTQIFDALNQADLVSGNPGMDNSFPASMPMSAPAPPPQGSMMNDGPSLQPSSDDNATAEEIEELVESVIEEKWAGFSKDISKVSEWKSDVDSRLAKMEQKINSMKDDFDKLHQAIIGKIGDYDKNILMVGAEVKAMEKVFSKVLPVFTENVSELSRITQTMTSAAKKKE